MRRAKLSAGVLAVVVWCQPWSDAAKAVTGPTFDCGGARAQLSRLICLHSEAAEADWSLIKAYWPLYFSREGAERKRLRDEHVRWIKGLTSRCKLGKIRSRALKGERGKPAADCIAKSYRDRAVFYQEALAGDALIESKLAPEELLRIQESLKKRGLLEDDADGVFGATTREAIQAYKASLGHAAGNFLSAEEREGLLKPLAAERAESQSPQVIKLTPETPVTPESIKPTGPRPLSEEHIQTIAAGCLRELPGQEVLCRCLGDGAAIAFKQEDMPLTVEGTKKALRSSKSIGPCTAIVKSLEEQGAFSN